MEESEHWAAMWAVKKVEEGKTGGRKYKTRRSELPRVNEAYSYYCYEVRRPCLYFFLCGH